ncbi:globin-coupled sensor protein [Anaerobacillus alkaliphilus]|uniref:Globin-coupled sensor protein n=2 Tax=Anaerobacillus alkaliphilus TaxID=1548597 RepID=A0A4Q0VQB5_9BACI|nr:globin-coupled sensor protein [Anaerobacillus alkaliphilus]
MGEDNMIFSKQKKKVQSVFSQELDVEVRIDRSLSPDIQLQLAMIDLTERDLKILKIMQPHIVENVDQMTAGFYERVTKVPHLTAIIQNNSSVEGLQKTLRTHLLEMFNGIVDNVFVSKREKIAHVHVRIGLEPRWYMAAFNVIFEILQKIILENYKSTEDRVLAINAVNKILNFEQQLVLTAYELKGKMLREESDRHAKTELASNVGTSAELLASTAQETHASTTEMANQSKVIKEASSTGKSLSEEVQQKSQAGTEKMNQLTQQISVIKNRVEGIVENAETLDNNAREIQGIVRIILDIAEQTNLLALNAAIEAARAGEAGKGFSVVAEEVRKLADQTKSSSSKVSEISGRTNEQIRTMESSIQSINEIVISSVQTTESVHSILNQILTQAKESNSQNTLIEIEISSLVSMLSDISLASEEVASTATRLSQTITDYTGM